MFNRLGSAWGLSPEEIQASLHDPRVAELMRGASLTLADAEEVSDEFKYVEMITQLRERWRIEATLPPIKPAPTRRSQREAGNQSVIDTMIGGHQSPQVLSTFIGQEKHFSSTPIEKLQSGSLGSTLSFEYTDFELRSRYTGHVYSQNSQGVIRRF